MARTAAKTGASAPRATPRRRFRWLAWVIMLGVWGGVALGAAVLLVFAWDLPRPEAALAATRRPAVTLLAADGRVLATQGDLYGEMVRLRDLPAHLPAALLAVEDRRFRSHHGLDVIGLARALWVNVAPRAGGAGRLHPDPAAGQEPVPDAGAQPPPQGAGGAAGALAGTALQQGRDRWRST